MDPGDRVALLVREYVEAMSLENSLALPPEVNTRDTCHH
jgi:hypothetical protein